MKKVMSNTKTKRKKSGGVFRKENKNNVIDADKKV